MVPHRLSIYFGAKFSHFWSKIAIFLTKKSLFFTQKFLVPPDFGGGGRKFFTRNLSISKKNQRVPPIYLFDPISASTTGTKQAYSTHYADGRNQRCTPLATAATRVPKGNKQQFDWLKQFGLQMICLLILIVHFGRFCVGKQHW